MSKDFEKKLDKVMNQMSDIQKQFSQIVEDYNAVRQQNLGYRKAILGIEKAVLELRLSELDTAGMDIPRVQKTLPSSVGMQVLVNEQPVIPTLDCTQNVVEEPTEESCEDVSVEQLKEIEVVKQKPSKKRGRPKGAGVKKKEVQIEEGGSVFPNFEALDISEVAEDHEHMSAYLASDDDLAKAKEEDSHPNRLGALGAVCSTSKAI